MSSMCKSCRFTLIVGKAPAINRDTARYRRCMGASSNFRNSTDPHRLSGTGPAPETNPNHSSQHYRVMSFTAPMHRVPEAARAWLPRC